MKLASLKSGGRDGTLIVVSKNLKKYVQAGGIATTMRDAIEAWDMVAPKLQAVAAKLEQEDMDGIQPLDVAALAAPFPRSFQWCDGSAYLHHAELVRKARNAEMGEELYREPLMYQGGSDGFLGPCDPIEIASEAWGIDLEAEIAVVTDDVPMGTFAPAATEHIKLLMLVNDVSLRNLMPAELAKGFGFFVSKPATSFAPVAVTPDELGPAWDGRKLSLPVTSHVNGKWLGAPDAGADLYFDFPALIAHAATSRHLAAGTIIGSGTVSNRDTSRGSSCLQEVRMLEKIATGEMKTPLLRFGDEVRIEVIDGAGKTVFGEIRQTVRPYGR